MLTRSTNRQLGLWKNLEKIKTTIGASEVEFSALLGLTSGEYRRFAHRAGYLPVEAITELSERLPLSMENVARGDIDLTALQEHFRGNHSHIPSRYRPGAFSKRRTSINALYFVEKHLSTDAKKRMLNHFQVHESVFENPDATINIRFIKDLLQYLARFNGGRETFIQIGKYSTFTNLRGKLADVYSACKSPEEMFDQLVNELMSSYDENYDYRFKTLSKTRAVLTVSQRKETEEALGEKCYGSLPICWLRVGLLSAIPQYQSLPNASVSKTKCVFNGDPCCEMEIDFSAAEEASAKRRA